MRKSAFVIAALMAFMGTTAADPWKDESGKGRWGGGYGQYGRYYGDPRSHFAREYKEEYHLGSCKVERKLERSGEYKEEIKCKGRRRW